MCPCAALIASFSSSFSFFSFHFFLHIFLFSTPPTLVILFLAPCHSPTRIGVLLVCFFSLCKSLLTLLPLTISSCLSASVLVSCLTFLLQFSCCSCSHTHTHTHAHTHTLTVFFCTFFLTTFSVLSFLSLSLSRSLS